MGHFIRVLLLLWCFAIPVSGWGRTLAGVQGGREIRFETTLLSAGEYVNVRELLPYFQNAYEYDALAGIIQFIRGDGVTIGTMVGDNRIVVDQTLHVVLNRTIRQNNSVYISLEVVDTYLFPQMEFQSVTNDSEEALNEERISSLRGTPTPSRFMYATPTPGAFQRDYPFAPFPHTDPLRG